MTESKTITLSLDDFNPLNHRFDLLDKMKERFDGFKITMFTIPWDIRTELNQGGLAINQERFIPWVNAVRHSVEKGWLEVAIHGLTHVQGEFQELDEKHASSRIKFAKEFFKQTKIDYVPLFKAPYWQASDGTKKAVKKAKLTLLEDGYYNWNIKDPFPVELDKIIAHGHVQNTCDNGLEESFMRLMEIPGEYKWQFLSKALNED